MGKIINVVCDVREGHALSSVIMYLFALLHVVYVVVLVVTHMMRGMSNVVEGHGNYLTKEADDDDSVINVVVPVVILTLQIKLVYSSSISFLLISSFISSVTT